MPRFALECFLDDGKKLRKVSAYKLKRDVNGNAWFAEWFFFILNCMTFNDHKKWPQVRATSYTSSVRLIHLAREKLRT